jgi:hypothetical protein
MKILTQTEIDELKAEVQELELQHRAYHPFLAPKKLSDELYLKQETLKRAPFVAKYNKVVAAAQKRLTALRKSRKAKGLPYPDCVYEGSWAHQNEFFPK